MWFRMFLASVLMLGFLIGLFIVPAYAANVTFTLTVSSYAATSYSCLSGNVLNQTDVNVITDNSGTNTVTNMHNSTCQYGCEQSFNGTARCIDASQANLGVPIVWIIGSILFAFFGVFINNKNMQYLSPLFFFVSIYLLLNSMTVMLQVGYASGWLNNALLGTMNTGLVIVTTVLEFTFAMYVVFMLWELLKMMIPKMSSRNNRKR